MPPKASEWDLMVNAGTDKKSVNKVEPKIQPTTPVKAGVAGLAYTDEQIKDWLFKDIERSSSNVCCGIYGFDGTAKSGIALDCRTEQEIKDGYKIIVFDLDGGCAPLKVIYHDNDKNIIIKNPQVRDDAGSVDYEGTFTKLKKTLDYIEKNLSTLKIKAIVFDGIDKFLKICEYSMREDLNKTITEGVNYLYWKLRNQKYHDIMEQIKLMDVDRFFITHLKKIKDTEDWTPDWEKKTPDMMFQKLKCFKEVKVINGEKIICLKAEIEKCKTNLALEGSIFTIAEIRTTSDKKVKAIWKGLKFNKDNSVAQNIKRETNDKKI